MTFTFETPFPQELQTSGISFGASSQETDMDPSTVAPTALLTAGDDGALVTDVTVTAESTVTDEKFVLWRQPGGVGSWFVAGSAVLATYTQDATDTQGTVKLIDREVPEGALRLGSGEKLGVTHHVDQQSMVMSEYTDF